MKRLQRKNCLFAPRPGPHVFALKQALQEKTREASNGSTSFRRWKCSNSRTRRKVTTSWSRSSAMRKLSCRSLDCITARCCYARAIWDLRQPRLTTLRSGFLPRTNSWKFLPAQIAKRSRRGEPGFASGPKAAEKARLFYPLNGGVLSFGGIWSAFVENYQRGEGSVVIREFRSP